MAAVALESLPISCHLYVLSHLTAHRSTALNGVPTVCLEHSTERRGAGHVATEELGILCSLCSSPLNDTFSPVTLSCLSLYGSNTLRLVGPEDAGLRIEL